MQNRNAFQNNCAEVVDLGVDWLTYFGNSIGRERDAIADNVDLMNRTV